MIGAVAIVFAAAMASGMPIVFVLGITSLVMLLILGEPLSTVPQVMFASLNSFPLMALPFFAISAYFMVKGGTSERLIKAATTYVGHLPGGMALVTIMACMIFASLSGSSSATALAIGAITIPAMVDRGYDRAFSAAVVGSGGTLGILIPPSLNMILFGVIAGKLLTGTANGETLIVQQTPDLTDHQHVVTLIVAAVTTTLDRLELLKFLLPVP